MLGGSLLSGPLAGGGAWPGADIFGDGSNMFTSNFSNSTPSVIEGNGASIFVNVTYGGTMGFNSNVPKPGFVKSLVGTANQVNQLFDGLCSLATVFLLAKHILFGFTIPE